jgi:exonuclease SbcD
MIKLLHFADAHIDVANYGRHDSQTGLPVRVMDFLYSLDTIVDTAIEENVDLVIFAGDAFKDRNPAPTFQREWGKRIMRLSKAGILTLLLVGNHDLSPAFGRAHALQSFDTLEVPHVKVIDRPTILGTKDLEGKPLQVMAIPWISRSGLMAHFGLQGIELSQVMEQIETHLIDLVNQWLEEEVDPALPTILAAHCSVEGAIYGGERTVVLGKELVLPGSLMRDSRLNYVALGHIHKGQDLNEGGQPPVIYPGSIERVDFGEVNDDKFFVIAHVGDETQVEWHKLKNIRLFIDRYLILDDKEGVTNNILNRLPSREQLEGAIFRLTLEYPRDWEALIDEAALRAHAAACLEFQLVKRPQFETRIRISADHSVGSLRPIELLELYWRAIHIDSEEYGTLSNLATQLIKEVSENQSS